MCIKQGKQKQFTGVNLKQVCNWIGVSRVIKQISTSNLVAFFTHKQDVQLVWQAMNIIICSAV